MNRLTRKLTAEFTGTLWLILGGCGSAVLAGNEIGLVGVSLAFGFAVLAMAFAIGHISGCHLNPAVTIGLFVAGRFERRELFPYIAAQVLGGIVGGAILFLIASGMPNFDPGGFASNGYGELSPGGYRLLSVFLVEVVMTAVFLFVILGATCKRAPAGLAPVAIGFCLTLIHLVSIPVSNTSVNPARSLAAAVFSNEGHLGQVWLFWLAPIIGGVLGALLYKAVGSEQSSRTSIA